VNRAEESAGKHHTAGGLENDRADMLAAERMMGEAPIPPIFTLQQDGSVFGADPELPRTIAR
jgi:hypothetical protein